jgi:hypothetical protein
MSAVASGSLFPPVQPTVARSQLVIDFIAGLGWDGAQETGYPLYPGPEILTEPDKAVFLTPSGGPGYVTEEAALDTWTFQARVRGDSDDPLGPELAAQLLDWMLLTARHPQLVDGMTVSMCARTGAPPTVLPLNPADRRFEFVTTYLITTGGG